nr:Serine/threonine-protein kinase C70.05C [Ipomoea batatas]
MGRAEVVCILKRRKKMASMASPYSHSLTSIYNKRRFSYYNVSSSSSRIFSCQKQPQQEEDSCLPQMGRRELILRSSEIAVLGAIFSFSGPKPNYLGVQKSPLGLALCPATNNCISTSENISDLTHYAPPWNYNPEEKRGKVSREKAMKELLEVIKSTKPDKSMPKIVEKKDDYVRVEYQSPILGLVDDVEFWFSPGKKPLVQYRSASRKGNYDFDANRKRIKVRISKKTLPSCDVISAYSTDLQCKL